MISVKNISKRFGKVNALHEVSVDFTAGKGYALAGPNGSGKTTLIKSILGLVVPTSGEILFAGKPIANEWLYRQNIGYMPQIGRYPENMKIGEVIDMMKNIRTDRDSFDEELIEVFRLSAMYDKRMHTLSGGTRQKVSAALAFLSHPRVLILDEPTAGLDPVSAEILKEKILKEKVLGKLVIVTSHILSDLDDLTTEILYLYDGRVQYNNSIASLKEETGEKRLGRAIATFINQNQLLSSVKE